MLSRIKLLFKLNRELDNPMSCQNDKNKKLNFLLVGNSYFGTVDYWFDDPNGSYVNLLICRVFKTKKGV